MPETLELHADFYPLAAIERAAGAFAPVAAITVEAGAERHRVRLVPHDASATLAATFANWVLAAGMDRRVGEATVAAR